MITTYLYVLAKNFYTGCPSCRNPPHLSGLGTGIKKHRNVPPMVGFFQWLDDGIRWRVSVVRPAMVYGLETVTVTKKQMKELEVAEMKMLRFAMGVTRKDKIRNEYIRRTVKVERLEMKMREGKLRWYGHVMRRDQDYVGRKMMEMETGKKEKRETKEKIFRCSERR